MMGLTSRQVVALAFIREHLVEHGAPPTFQQIADHLGLAKSSVHRLVQQLVDRGHLRQPWNRRQALSLVEPGLRGDSEGLLAQLAQRRGTTRDRLVQQAVTEFLDRELRA